jgi:hypothetical protein
MHVVVLERNKSGTSESGESLLRYKRRMKKL